MDIIINATISACFLDIFVVTGLTYIEHTVEKKFVLKALCDVLLNPLIIGLFFGQLYVIISFILITAGII